MSDVGTALNQAGVKRWKSKLLALGVIRRTPRIRRSTTPHYISQLHFSQSEERPSDTFAGFLNQLASLCRDILSLNYFLSMRLKPIKTLVSYVFIKYIFKQSQR